MGAMICRQCKRLCAEPLRHDLCCIECLEAFERGDTPKRIVMTVEEAKEWLDSNMSGGASYNDAQSLTVLLDKVRADTLQEALDAGEQAAVEILTSKGIIGTPTEAKITRDDMHYGVLKTLEKLRALGF